MDRNPHILSIDESQSVARKLETFLGHDEHTIHVVPDFQSCINRFLISPPDIVLAGRFTLDYPPHVFIHKLRNLKKSLTIFILLEQENMKTAVNCIKAGADDVFLKTDIAAIGAAIQSHFPSANGHASKFVQPAFVNDACVHLTNEATCRLTYLPDGSIKTEYVSDGIWELMGKTPEDDLFDLEHLYDFVHPDDRTLYQSLRTNALERLEPISYEMRLITADGGLKWIRENNLFLKEANGNIIVEKHLADITKCKEIEAQLHHYKKLLETQELEEACRYEDFEEDYRRREAFYLKLFEHFSDIIVVLDQNGIIKYESPSVTKVLGYSLGERLDHSAFELIHPDDTAFLKKFLHKYKDKAGEIPRFEFKAHQKDGRWLHFECNGYNLLDDPIINGILMIVRDVTLRKQAEEKSKASEQLFRSLFISAAVPMCLIDEKGNFVDINPACCLLSDYSAEELKGRFFATLICDDQRDAALLAFKTFVDTSVYKSTEHWIGQTKYGRKIELNTSAASFCDYNGNRFIILSFEDITDRNRAIRELTEIKQQLQVKVEEKHRNCA
ncbi:putative PAS/PAC sensor protein [Chloroherpeton thalassium ATCC 35110]|uniref:histidine kinase n=1 Tax=Chloroherpeton thalassium (strain ATCC 35110 / GB-78) TaxID=517418 RepID=B3QYS4_CHLT3|nr:PAS domain S-box protein [Chloroherpeton thalassium]ACF15147.1 putative PAS/PAC sensor protein [Chloroherpeton thalassium ATCC 35110]